METYCTGSIDAESLILNMLLGKSIFLYSESSLETKINQIYIKDIYLSLKPVIQQLQF